MSDHSSSASARPHRGPSARSAHVTWERSASFEELVSLALSQVGELPAPIEDGQSRDAGVYIISVAARLAHMHPQTLRKYDRAEVVSPSRTGGMLRLYSDDDVEQLRTVSYLVDELGLNLEGVRLVMGMAEVLADVVSVLEEHPELAGSAAAKLIAGELRGVIEYVNGIEPTATG